MDAAQALAAFLAAKADDTLHNDDAVFAAFMALCDADRDWAWKARHSIRNAVGHWEHHLDDAVCELHASTVVGALCLQAILAADRLIEILGDIDTASIKSAVAEQCSVWLHG